MTDSLNAITDHPFAFFLALGFLLAVGPFISILLRALGDDDKIAPPRGADLYIWNQIVATQGEIGGRWVGRLERLLFFSSIFFSPAVIVAWLAFKVASKWEAWTNLYKVPDIIRGVDPLDFLRARVALGSRIYQRFLVGTSANLMASFLGFGLFYWLLENFPCL